MISRRKKQKYISFCSYKAFRNVFYIYKKIKCQKFLVKSKDKNNILKKYVKNLRVNQIFKIRTKFCIKDHFNKKKSCFNDHKNSKEFITHHHLNINYKKSMLFSFYTILFAIIL